MPTPQSKSSQDFVPIKEVRDGVLILDDGSYRSIVMTSSTNFALKSEENQQAIISQFQDFLNSLDFSIQIFIQSRKFDINPYIALLEERFQSHQTELMQMQTREYIEFIKSFTENVNIMTKSFFVVVPFLPSAGDIRTNPLGTLKALGSLKGKKGPDAADPFQEHAIQLDQRIAVVEQGLTRCGLRTVRLGSEEIVEIFYKLFNPGDSQGAPHMK